MDVLKDRYSAGKGSTNFSVDEGCSLPMNWFSEQYQRELSSATQVLQS